MNIGPAWRQWRPILFFGAAGGLLVASLRFIEYRFLVVEHSIEIYSGLIALLFAAVGIRLGLTLTKTREVTVIKEVAVAAPIEFVRNEQQVAALAITPRELDILDQIAAGKSTREIAQDAVRQREHRQDPRQPPVRQARGEAADAGRAGGEASRALALEGPDPESRERMILTVRPRNHPKV